MLKGKSTALDSDLEEGMAKSTCMYSNRGGGESYGSGGEACKISGEH